MQRFTKTEKDLEMSDLDLHYKLTCSNATLKIVELTLNILC